MRLPVPSTARTRRVLLGGGGLLASRILSGFSGLLLTAIVSRYLSAAEFGLWSILSSLPLLVATMDFGLGNTLRNRMASLSASQAQSDETKKIFFACFKGFIVVSSVVVVLLWAFYQHVPWHWLFSFHHYAEQPAWTAACAVSVSALLIYLPLSLGNFGLLAYQETHWSAILDAVKSVLIFVGVFVAVKVGASFLPVIASFYTALLISAFISLGYFLARRGWRFVWPKWKVIWPTLKSLAPESSHFALLQMSAGVILLTDTILVSWACGLDNAGDYALVQKLYFYIVATESLLLTPLWSAYTEAHVQKDRAWIIAQLKRSILLTIVLLASGAAFCGGFGPLLIRIWTHKVISMPSLFLAMTVWVWVYGLSHCLSVYLNAIGRVHRQAFLAGFAAIANVPLAIWLGHRWGPAGVCWAGVFCILPSLINNPIEVFDSLRRAKS